MADANSPVSTVAERYANALFELATEENALPAVEADIGRFAAMVAESDDLERLLRSPVFSAEEQERAVAVILDKAEIGGLVANFVKVVAGNRRLFAVPDMIVSFRRLLAAHRGEVSAEVTSAEPLADRHVAALKDALRTALGKDVALEAKVDPSLIGGLVIRVGSRMIDSSLKTKLSALKLAMKEVG